MSVWGRGPGPQVNKFEQVSSDDHQMSVALGGSVPCLVSGKGGGGLGLMSGIGGGEGTCTVRSNASFVMVTWGPP